MPRFVKALVPLHGTQSIRLVVDWRGGRLSSTSVVRGNSPLPMWIRVSSAGMLASAWATYVKDRLTTDLQAGGWLLLADPQLGGSGLSMCALTCSGACSRPRDASYPGLVPTVELPEDCVDTQRALVVIQITVAEVGQQRSSCWNTRFHHGRGVCGEQPLPSALRAEGRT